MKKYFLSILVFTSMWLAGLAFAKPAEESLDQLLVIVNDDVITASELNRALDITKIQISQSQMPMPPEAVLKKQVIDQLINKKLELQIAKQNNVQVNDTELNKIIENVAKQNQLSVKELYDRLNQDGMSTTDYRKEMRDQLTVQKLQQQELASRITITPQEVTNFMRSKIWQTNGTKEYRIEDILVPFSDTPSTGEIAGAKKTADAILIKLQQGRNFRELAQSESTGQHALQGGDLGWRKLPEIPSAFADQIVNIKLNNIAGPIQTANGFHIIRLVGIRDAENKQDIPTRKQIEQLLLQRKFEEALQTWISKIRAQAFIAYNPVK